MNIGSSERGFSSDQSSTHVRHFSWHYIENLVSRRRSSTWISYNGSHCYEINAYFDDILKAIGIQSIFPSPLSTIIQVYNFTWISKPKRHAIFYHPIYPRLPHNQVSIRFSKYHLKGWYSATYSSTFAGTSCVCKDDDGRMPPALTSKCCHLQSAPGKNIEFNGSEVRPQFPVMGSNNWLTMSQQYAVFQCYRWNQ